MDGWMDGWMGLNWARLEQGKRNGGRGAEGRKRIDRTLAGKVRVQLRRSRHRNACHVYRIPHNDDGDGSGGCALHASSEPMKVEQSEGKRRDGAGRAGKGSQ